MHNASVIQLGSSQSSAREVETVAVSPVTWPAGTVARLKSDGTLSKIKADGPFYGVSMGRSLSNTLKTAFARTGLRIPVLLSVAPARLIITITSYANLIAVSDDTLQFEHEGEELDELITFKAVAVAEGEVAAVTSNTQTAINLAAKINAHSVLSLVFKAVQSGAVVTLTAKNNALDGADFDVTLASNASVGLTLDDDVLTGGGETAADYVVKGAKAYISDELGLADDSASAATVSDATYAEATVYTGLDEDGNEAACALVDMPGGL